MGKITYGDKDKNSDLQARREWRDIDANEVKNSVNALYDTLPFTAITVNQYGVHPAFPTQHSLNVWLLQKAAGATAAPVLSISTTQSNVTTNGGSNGSITATGSGGTAPYTYNLNGGAYQPGGTFSGLAAGTYAVGVKDSTGATVSKSVTLSQPAATALPTPAAPTLEINDASDTALITIPSGLTVADLEYQFTPEGQTPPPLETNTQGGYVQPGYVEPGYVV